VVKLEIMGRGLKQIVQETPCYVHLLSKYLSYKLFDKKSPLYGSADIINVCNLHCTHCYWWLNRKENEELTVEQWKDVIKNKFKKHHVFIVTLVGGEPTLRPDVVELFAKEFPRRICIVTNGTLPIKKIDGVYFYWVSIDGTRQIHDKIRGTGSYDATRKNIIDYIENNGQKAWKDIWISMTVNSLNYKTVKDVIDEWYDYANKIAFQFHTPFAKGDPLWLPFGPERTKIIDEIISMKEKYDDDYIINPTKQLELLKRNWGGEGTTPIDCPTWTILSVDHLGRQKMPCCIGSADKDSQKPICEECGLACYSVFINYGMKG
jgi:MoaA/NifB/PqqE/SkfB family radical SAM enzyme